MNKIIYALVPLGPSGSEGNGGCRFDFVYLENANGNKIGLDLDFTTSETAVNAVKGMIKEVPYDIVKGLDADERITAINRTAYTLVRDTFDGPLIQRILSEPWDDNWDIPKQQSILTRLGEKVPSIGVLITALRKRFGEVSTEAQLLGDFRGWLTPQIISQMVEIGATIKRINIEQTDAEKRLPVPLSKQSEAERNNFLRGFNRRREAEANKSMPYKIIFQLNFTHLPQSFRDEEELKILNAGSPTRLEISRIKKDTLTLFKLQELQRYLSDPVRYVLPSKSSV